MAYPSEHRPASPPVAAESPMASLPPEPAPPPEPSLAPTGATPPAAASDPSVPAPEPPAPPAVAETRREPVRVPRTRISAVWFGVWAGVAALILLVIFIGQNTSRVRISFLWMTGNFPLALALIIAGIGGALVAMAVAAARIIQLRRLFRRSR